MQSVFSKSLSGKFSGVTVDTAIRFALIVVFVGVVAFVGIRCLYGLQIQLNSQQIEWDSAFFAEMARLQLNGGLPYRDRWDIKPPGVFVFLMPFVALFGNTVKAVNIAIVTNDLLFALVLSALAYTLTRSKLSALVAGLLALLHVLILPDPRVETTVLMATLTALSLIIASLGRGRPLWMAGAGLVFVGAVLTKQPAIVEFPIVLAFAALHAPNKRWRALAGVTAGALIGGSVFTLWLVTNGLFANFWQHVVADLPRYAQATDPGEAQAMFQVHFLDRAWPRLAPLLGLAALSTLPMVRRIRRPPLGLLILWAVVTVFAASRGKLLKYEYFVQALPPILMLIALAVAALRKASPWLQGLPLVAGALAMVTVASEHVQAPPYFGLATPADVAAGVAYVEAHTDPDDCLWIWGTLNVLHYLTGRPSCNARAMDNQLTLRSLYVVDRYQDEYMRELIERTPALFVENSGWAYFPRLQRYVDRYVRERVLHTENFDIYAVDRSAWHPRYANFGHEIALLGFDLPPADAYCPGDTLLLAMTWQPLVPPAHDYQMFVKVLTVDQQVEIASYSGRPGDRPTYWWTNTDAVILGDEFDLRLPATTQPGQYSLFVGLYEVESRAALEVIDEAGQSAGTHAGLANIDVVDDCGL